MARVAKAPLVRRNELIDCAQALFSSVGYEATTVADIIKRANISKGGFYHHFDSKEALLEAYAERLIAEVLAGAQGILQAPGRSALERLNALFLHSAAWKMQSGAQLRGAFEAVLKLENDVLYQRIAKAAWRVMRPTFEALIDDGVRAGQFSPADAAITAEIILNVFLSRQRTIAEAMADLDHGDLAASTAKLEARIQAEESVIDRLLGVPPGSVSLAEPGFVHDILEAMQSA